MRARSVSLIRILMALAAGLALGGCNCARLSGEVEGVKFTRCAQVDPPAARTLQAGAARLSVVERTLTVQGVASLRIAAFSGPVSGLFAREDLARLAEARASLLLWLGGLGSDEASTAANLAALAALGVPTVFVPGGADRWPLVEAAFDGLADGARQHMINGSGLRELVFGRDRFAVLPGSAQGRYAVDEEACGFDAADLRALQDAVDDADAARHWLLTWSAPRGWGITVGLGSLDVGSAAVAELATTLQARGGLFAYPETQTAIAVYSEARGGHAMVVPRLGPTGSARAQGGRIPSGFSTLVLSQAGLVPAP